MSGAGFFRAIPHHKLKALDDHLPDGTGVIVYFPSTVQARLGIGVDLGETELALLGQYPKSVNGLGTATKIELLTSLEEIGAHGTFVDMLERDIRSDIKPSDDPARTASYYAKPDHNGGATAGGCLIGLVLGVVTWVLAENFVFSFASDTVATVLGLVCGLAVGVGTFIGAQFLERSSGKGVENYFTRVRSGQGSILDITPPVEEFADLVTQADADIARLDELGHDTSATRNELSRMTMDFVRACLSEKEATHSIELLRDLTTRISRDLAEAEADGHDDRASQDSDEEPR